MSINEKINTLPVIEQVFHPWRRFFARLLDFCIYSILWSAVLAFLFHVNVATRGDTWRLFDSFITIGLMFILEPLWLN